MSDTRSCPFCAEDIKKKSKLCRFCGNNVDPMYVDDEQANKQISYIIKMRENNYNYSEISKYLNDQGFRRLDGGTEWDPEKIQQICDSFLSSEKKNIVTPNVRTKQSNTWLIVGLVVVVLLIIGSLQDGQHLNSSRRHLKNAFLLISR